MAFFSRHTTTLSAVLALNFTKVVIEGEAKPLEVHFVTGNFFHELGAVPRIGRIIEAGRDDAPGAEPVAVLSYGFWQRHFGGEPQVIGRSVQINGKSATVVGVTAPEFNGLSMGEPALWTPIVLQPHFAAGSKLLTDFSVESPGVQMWGRLRPGVAPKAAEEELAALAAALRKEQPTAIWENESLPSEPGGYATGLMRTGRRGTGSEGPSELVAIFSLIGVLVLLILAVACANLGSLLLARGAAREREIAVRVAVGAGRGRLVRQLFTESLLLAILGSVAAIGLGGVVLRALMAVSGAPLWLDPTPDWRVILFTVGLAFAAAILFGLAPAIQVARGRRRTTVRQILVAAQVAASCVLLIVAGLLTRALNHATTADPGFEYQHVVSIDPGLAQHGYSPAAARAHIDTLQNRLRSVPGVESVSLSLTPPLGRRSVGGALNTDRGTLDVQMHRVDPEFFTTMKIPLLRGRSLRHGEANTAVVSDTLARSLWPGEDPIGKTLSLAGDYTVVGVSRNARLIRIENSDSVEAYMPLTSGDLPSAAVLVRTSGPPEAVARSLVAAAKALAPDVFPEVQLLRENYRRKVDNAEKSALAVGLLGSVAHLLACLGIVGVVAFAVSQRTREIGIRMALGAEPSHVISVVLRHLSLPVSIGFVLGVGGAAALSQLLRGQLYGISHLDVASYLIAIGVFAVTIFLAAWLPARRALRIDPLVALRHE
jgi:predicted permease